MARYCQQEHIVMTPYSPLVSVRLARHIDVATKRLQEDNYAQGEYDKTVMED